MLPQLPAERGSACFDLIFIDADKPNYPNYVDIFLLPVADGITLIRKKSKTPVLSRAVTR